MAKKQIPDIKYLNKTFPDFKSALINYAKSYFPNTVNDFSDDSPGTMFIEMASYVGDVLSFYIDRSVQENFLEYALNYDNIISLAYTLGYRPKVTATATVTLDCYQQLPATISASIASPDYNYALVIDKEAKITSATNSNVTFLTQDVIDFSFSSSASPTTSSVLTVDSVTGQPDMYLLKKSVTAIAGTIKTQTFTFGVPQKFNEVIISDTDIIQVIGVTDSDNNNWYEVPYLAQSTIFKQTANTYLNDPFMSQFNNTVPYLLQLERVQRRFTTRFDSTKQMHIEFGAGVSSSPDEIVIPNPENVGMGLIDSVSKLDQAYDPANFLYTNEYGLAPGNTTLTFTYIVGGGVETNVPSEDIVKITGASISSVNSNPNTLNGPLLQTIINSVGFSNPQAASGGGAGDTVDDVRYKGMASYSTQLRCVTMPDYVVRAVSMPSQYGTVAKAYAVKDSAISVNEQNNPLAISLYILSYDSNQNLTYGSLALKQNLKNYISQYKIDTDAVSIKDAYYINIGVNFDIIVLPSYNSRQVLASCLSAVSDFFNIDYWQINQPIVLSDIYNVLIPIKGVQSVPNITVINKQGVANGYSQFGYDIAGATLNDVIYPSLDPSIFECRYPQNDINGRVISL